MAAKRFGRLGLVALAAWALAGCQAFEAWFGKAKVAEPAGVVEPVPEPLDVLLPKAIRIHPFTGTRVFDAGAGIRGIDVRIEALDAYGDAGKAFGRFRFELFRYKARSGDPKGERLEVWNVSVESPRENRFHWIAAHRTYQFKLEWRQPIPVGQRFVLTAVFESRFTPRLFDEKVFVAGE